MDGKICIKVDDPDTPPSHPPPPPPKRLSRPKITLSIPENASHRGQMTGQIPIMTPRGTPGPMYWNQMRYHGKAPMTPGSHVSDPHGNPYFNPFMHMYHNKASDFMFKQFEGFKDFTMNTAKSGLSAGEKTAFWFYNKLSNLSKKWFTHLFLTLCLALYSVMGAAIFMALEGTHEVKENKNNTSTMNLTEIRRNIAVQIETAMKEDSWTTVSVIEDLIKDYEQTYTECLKHTPKKKMWGFWNSMFYAGTIYTTIDICFDPDVIKVLGLEIHKLQCDSVMSEGGNEEKRLTLQIPIIRAESETQTCGLLVSKTPDKNPIEMESEAQRMSLRKRRNLSKNRGQAARQREKTPEPGRTPIHEDTTSDDEDTMPQRNSREIEADNTYEEMKRLVQEQANVKDPVYDLDIDKVLEQRALAARDRRRRSISPFAVQDEKEEGFKLERKGSFTDPTNKLLSANYTFSPKEEDPTKRRNSLTLEAPADSRSSVSPPTPSSTSPKQKDAPFPIPSTPKNLEKMVYPDEVKEKAFDDKARNLRTPVSKEEVFTFDDEDTKPIVDKAVTPNTPETPIQFAKPVKPKTPEAISPPVPLVKAVTPKPPDTPASTGEIVTKVIQIERTPSKKLAPDSRPVVEVRERIVRTPSRKLPAEMKPIISKTPAKPAREEPQSKAPPVKPARSKSASRFGSKTSESEMSEDQQNVAAGVRRKVVPTPRRFVKNRSPRANRSQSVARVEDLKVIDKSGSEMTQTSREILELMQKARARSLSIPKDDPRIPVEYKQRSKTLQTPQNKTPISRTSRGISCSKTIQIISDKEILSGLASKTAKTEVVPEKPMRRRRSSGYIDASQSEYTSSCYSSSPSENEYDFDLSERTAELTRKLKLLSQEVEDKISKDSRQVEDILKIEEEAKSIVRKRYVADAKNGVKKDRRESIEDKKVKKAKETKKPVKSRWKLIANWQQFKEEQKIIYDKIISLRNRCLCDTLLLIILFGLGGMMFRSLEGSFENAYKCGTRNVKRDFLESLWRGSHYLREEDWKSMARKKLFEFENQLHTAHEAGVTSYSGQRSWNFMNSFVYCMTLVTTIGYGHIAPKTTYGQVATIVYAIIGIPLFLIVLADFGKLFTRIIKFFWAFIRRFYYTRSCRKVRRTVHVQEVMKGLNIVYDVVRRPSQIFSEEDMEGADGEKPPPVERKSSDAPPPLPPKPGQVLVRDIDEADLDTPAPSTFEIDDEFNLPISVAIFILVVYIIIGATVYNIWEDWTFFESFYFVFISMSTIGLGDLVPDHPIFMMASILYLVFGLALTSMCINVVQVKLSDTFKQASAKLGATIGLKVADEDGSLVPITPPPTEMVPVHKPKVEKAKEEIKSKESDVNDDKKIS